MFDKIAALVLGILAHKKTTILPFFLLAQLPNPESSWLTNFKHRGAKSGGGGGVMEEREGGMEGGKEPKNVQS